MFLHFLSGIVVVIAKTENSLSAKKAASKKGGIIRRHFKKILIFVILMGILGISTVTGVFYYFSKELPKLDKLSDYKPKIKTKIFSSDSEFIGEFYVENREVIDILEVPKIMIDAIIAAEDKSFFEHHGIDYLGILRAAIKNIQAGGVVQGASTITQQVAKTFLLSSERKFKRKIKEAILAYRIETNFSKQEILHLYLNQIFFGHNSFGIKVAAKNYFGKEVADLNIAECAMLAALPKAPTTNSPFVNPEKARYRQLYVLKRMLEEKFITEDQYKQAKDYELNLKEYENVTINKTPYFTEHIRRYLKSRYGDIAVYEEGLNVYTTVDYKLQKTAREALLKGILDHNERQGYRGVTRHLADEEVDEFIGATKEDSGLAELEINKAYKDYAVVTKVNDKEKTINIQLGVHKGFIELSDLKIQTPFEGNIPPYKVQKAKPSEVFKAGDVIDVKVTDVKIEDLQKKEKSYKFSLFQEPLGEAALFSMDISNGFVRSMVGGYDFEKSEFNRAIQAHRLPGSAFKPVIYAAALDWKPKEEGKYFTPATIIYDTASVYDDGKWKPSNYGKQFRGAVSLRTALAKSVNLPAIKVLTTIGVDYVKEYAKKLNIDADINSDPTAALGSSAMTLEELTKVYGIFASGGLSIEPVFVTKILDRDGKVLEEYVPFEERPEYKAAMEAPTPKVDEVIDEEAVVAGVEIKDVEVKTDEVKSDPRRVMTAGTAYLMTSLLQSVVQEGTGARVKSAFGSLPLGGKTGTTNNCIDAWFIGFSPEIVTGVWVGIDERMSLGEVETGSRAAAPIWIDYMKEALKGKPVKNFPVPEGVEFAKINPATGLLARPDTKNPKFECFKKGTVPTEYSGKADELFIIDLNNDEEESSKEEIIIEPAGGSNVTKVDGDDDEMIPIAIP